MPLTSCKAQLKFSQQSFPELELPDLLHNIWCYTNRPNDPTCIQYQKWWVQEAKEDWQSYYKDFGHVIEKLKKQDKKFYKFGRISSQDKNVIYRIIRKEL